MAPAWFLPAMQELLQSVMPRLMSEAMSPTFAAVARLTNQLRGDGSLFQFCSVPFVDGSDPVTVRYLIIISVLFIFMVCSTVSPPFTSFGIIDGLSPQQIMAYFNGYGLLVTLSIGPNVDGLSRDALKRAVAGHS